MKYICKFKEIFDNEGLRNFQSQTELDYFKEIAFCSLFSNIYIYIYIINLNRESEIFY